MGIARSSIFALSVVVCLHTASANENKAATSVPQPVESPGSWMNPEDYPALALRYHMVGVTSFKLTVDATGKPDHCDVVKSSGFDILDRATCDRLMTNARFTPAHDGAGKPTEGTYASSVHWAIPPGSQRRISERFLTMLLTIDRTGKVTSCRATVQVPSELNALGVRPCEQGAASLPAALGVDFRGDYQGANADVEVEQADVFTNTLRDRVLAPKPGFRQVALNVYHVTVTKDGKIQECSYEEQRGIDGMASDFCAQAHAEIFDPPFSAFGEDGVASGWHISRALLKTNQ